MPRSASNAPTGRKTIAQGKALGHRPPTNPSPEGATQGWRTVKIGDIAAEVRYGSSSKTGENADGVPVIRMGNIINGALDFTKLKYLPAEHPEFPLLLLEPGDILFNRTNSAELVGKTAVYRGYPKKCSFASYLIRVRLREGIPEWVSYYLNSSFGRAWIKTVASQQCGQANVNGSKLKELEIPFPPVEEQRRIVARIEELFSRLDAGVAALRHAKAQLQRYRQSVLAAAVTGQFTQAWREQHLNTEPAEDLLKRILEDRQKNWGGRGKYKQPNPVEISAGAPTAEKPSHWPPVNLDMIVEQPQYGTSKKCTAAVAGSSVLRIPNVINGVVDPTDLKYAKFNNSELQKLSIRENDLLMIRSNGSLSIVGKTALVREPDTKHLYAGYLIRIRPSTPAIDGRFLSLTLASRPMRSQIEQKAKSTSGVNNINAKEIQALTLSLPPLAEQHQIVAEVEARATAIDHLEAELDRQISRSKRLRHSTLAAAFAGELFS
ncbi:MAG: restriction endonuclease subunit S [Luteolibacter sp.]